jgi:hypothetical protein
MTTAAMGTISQRRERRRLDIKRTVGLGLTSQEIKAATAIEQAPTIMPDR